MEQLTRQLARQRSDLDLLHAQRRDAQASFDRTVRLHLALLCQIHIEQNVIDLVCRFSDGIVSFSKRCKLVPPANPLHVEMTHAALLCLLE